MFDVLEKCKSTISLKSSAVQNPNNGNIAVILNRFSVRVNMVITPLEKDDIFLLESLAQDFKISCQIIHNSCVIQHISPSTSNQNFSTPNFEPWFELWFEVHLNIIDEVFLYENLVFKVILSINETELKFGLNLDDILSPKNKNRRALREFVSTSLHGRREGNCREATVNIIVVPPVLISTQYRVLDHSTFLLHICVENKYLKNSISLDDLTVLLDRLVPINKKELSLLQKHLDKFSRDVYDRNHRYEDEDDSLELGSTRIFGQSAALLELHAAVAQIHTSSPPIPSIQSSHLSSSSLSRLKIFKLPSLSNLNGSLENPVILPLESYSVNFLISASEDLNLNMSFKSQSPDNKNISTVYGYYSTPVVARFRIEIDDKTVHDLSESSDGLQSNSLESEKNKERMGEVFTCSSYVIWSNDDKLSNHY
jgi:hypothetical protein